MRISMSSIYVADQQAASDFYTNVLGFTVKHDVPIGEDRWLTLVSPESSDGVELQLDPGRHPAVDPYRKALYADGIAVAQFAVDDVTAEHARLVEAGVKFSMEPTDVGSVIIAVLDDTCGNHIQLAQYK